VHTRHLDWDGCFNARDLGGLRTVGDRRTRRGAIVRSDAVDRLTAAGWDSLVAHGIKTVIDLRNDDERREDVAPRPPRVTTVRSPLDAIEERDFWHAWDDGPQFGTPLYYRPHLARFPGRSADVIRAIARADDGGVLFHCQGGRDRSGLISMLVLLLAGVAHETIADDYALSELRLKAAYAARGEPDQGPMLAAYLAELDTTAHAVMLDTMRGFDVEAHLGPAGLGAEDVAALRARFVEGG
jgi:protein-tyrosine phosphatase